jgi:hypothetical protein|tara:strand:+ start:248 stop:787 length:540 start_codon:yes stop_codon:yes gene_type:complete
MKDEIAKHLVDKYEFLDKKDFWDCHGTPIIKHYALLKVALYESITFGKPEVLDIDLKNRICAIGITGTKKDKDGTVEVYDIGEASPQCNTCAYTTAMAIKRAKDRVAIKLLGLYGKIYSDADVVQDKDGNRAFAEEIRVWEGSDEESLTKAFAEVKNLKKETVIDLKKEMLTKGDTKND